MLCNRLDGAQGERSFRAEKRSEKKLTHLYSSVKISKIHVGFTHCDCSREGLSKIVDVGGDFRSSWWISVRLILARRANFSPINPKFTTRDFAFLQVRLPNGCSILFRLLQGSYRIMI